MINKNNLGQLLLLGLLLLPIACQNPILTFSGDRLTGEETGCTSFAFAKQYQILQLEVRPDNPYSVNLRVVMRNDKLYIDAAEKRRWHDYLKTDPLVRVKLGENVYRAKAVKIDTPEIVDTFIKGRTVYELVPRQEADRELQP